jgi:hypothetical protein
MPCVTALKLARSFPSIVLGPVLFLALFLLISARSAGVRVGAMAFPSFKVRACAVKPVFFTRKTGFSRPDDPLGEWTWEARPERGRW